MTIIYILIAVLMFGLLIAVHELGHFIAAKGLGVKVNEFAIGMGPRIFHRQKGETEYTLRLFPIGGFCAMEGEGEDSNDPRAFNNKSAWRRLIILVAGAFMNFVVGVLIFLFLNAGVGIFTTTTIDRFMDGFPLQGEQGLLPGDRILEVDGHAIYVKTDLDVFLGRAEETMDLVVERNGERVILDNLPLQPRQYPGEEGLKYGLYFTQKEANLVDKLQLTWYNAIDTVRLVWVSLGDLVTGAVGVRDMSGPVGIVSMIGQMGEQSDTTFIAFLNILNFTAFIAVNLAVMNLLPIPALDGGQILFLAVDKVYHLFTKKNINQKYLGYINAAGFILLIGLMIVVAFSDVLKLFGR